LPEWFNQLLQTSVDLNELESLYDEEFDKGNNVKLIDFTLNVIDKVGFKFVHPMNNYLFLIFVKGMIQTPNIEFEIIN